jgi:phosphohistidine phosphatase SixA
VRRRAFLASALAVPLLARAERGSRDTTSLEALIRRGGVVLLMRHASTEGGAGDPPGFRLDDCSTQRNLSAAGREEAARVGARLRSIGARIARVYTSPWCRCRETARLAFGKAEDWEPLGSFFERPELEADAIAHVRKRILGYTLTRPAGNVVMVTHNVNIAALTQLSVAPAEIVVVQPDGCCGVKVAGRLVLASDAGSKPLEHG